MGFVLQRRDVVETEVINGYSHGIHRSKCELDDQTLSYQDKMLGNYPTVNRKWFSLGQQWTNILKT